MHHTPKNSHALVVMLKVPVAGQVKTRLVPLLTEKDAARLYRRFIQDTFNCINILNGIDIIAAYTPKNLKLRVKKIVPAGTVIIPQKGKDLGQRLSNIFSELFSFGYKKIAIIGSDSPDLPIGYIKKSFTLLKGKTELVLGPAQDGGYYLIAMSNLLSPLGTDLKSVPKGGWGAFAGEIFQDIPWSTDAVFKKTMEKAKKAGLKAAILPKWYDVDDADSLKVLRNSLKISPVASKTNALMRKLF
jgi:rSAM/selenodomain-associated transferase 1